MQPEGAPVLALFQAAIDFNKDAAIEQVLQTAGRIALVVVLALVAVLLIRRLVRPVLGIAIREQMGAEPEIEVAKRVETLTDVVNQTTVTVIAIIALVTILPEFGINAGPLIAGLGLVGLAVGFGAQHIVKDVINGLEIITENQYARGDFVAMRTATGGSLSGVVEDINLHRTMLRDFDGNVHFIGHGQIDFVTNQTKGYSMVVVNLSVANSADLDHVYKVVGIVGTSMMKDASLAAMLREPPHAAGIERLGDGFLDIRVEGTTEPGDQWKIGTELRRRLKEAMAVEGIKSKD